jgi:hypothetical protein
MSEDLLARARAALEGVTSGPWVLDRMYVDSEGENYWDVDGPNGGWVAHCEVEPAARFIAASRQLLPELIARLVELEQAVARVRELAEKWDSAIESSTGNRSSVARAFAAEVFQTLDGATGEQMRQRIDAHTAEVAERLQPRITVKPPKRGTEAPD